MSTRFTFRCAGTEARCTTPGVKTIGREERASVRISEPRPPMPPDVSPSAVSCASRMSLFREIARARRAAGRSRTARRSRSIERARCASSSNPTSADGCASASGVGQRLVEEDVAVVEPAQVDADCAGVDADDARHL